MIHRDLWVQTCPRVVLSRECGQNGRAKMESREGRSVGQRFDDPALVPGLPCFSLAAISTLPP